MNFDIILYVLAFVFFIIAAPPASKGGWNFTDLAFAALVLSLLV